VTKNTTNQLKLYTERQETAAEPHVEAIASLPQVLQAFQRTTGWSMQYAAGPEPGKSVGLTWSAPVNPGVGTSPGHLRLDPLDSAPANIADRSNQNIQALATAIAGMLNELQETRHALWQREAELAAGVPLVPHREEEKHLAERLEAVLKGGAEAVGCHAAALYLLDDATTELKLRSCWGLSHRRLAAPARRLQGALADLEALLGHAVVLEDPNLMKHWNVPEDFPSAVCVPVSSPTILLGTLWIYCKENRSFNDRQTNILEVVAGRLAADLEREMLLREGLDAAGLKRQLAAAERLQRNQLPSISPMLDGWQVAGWTAQSEVVGGDFHDWFCLPNGLLAVAAGHSMDQGIAAAMSVSALKSLVRAHGQYHRDPQQALKQINLTLWTGSAGDQHASLFYGLIETATGQLRCALAGAPSAIIIQGNAWKSLSRASMRLGESPETDFQQFCFDLQPGQSLVVFTEGVHNTVNQKGHPLGEAGMANVLAGKSRLSAEQLLALAQKHLEIHAAKSDCADRTILVVKRTDA
jgi:phosphoserine phosphatase RsbU/P